MPAYSSLRYPKKTLMKASSFDVLRQMTSNEEIVAEGEQTSKTARSSLSLLIVHA